jgi:hypothetical protein
VRLDRRVPFFGFVSLLSFAMVPLADKGLRYVPVVVGITYVVLSLAFLLDWLGRRAEVGRTMPHWREADSPLARPERIDRDDHMS